MIQKNGEIEVLGNKLKNIETNGWLTRVFFRELRGLGKKVFGELPKNETREETKNFLEFLNTISTSEKGSHYPLNFLGRDIRVGVLLVASYDTLAMSGLRTHKNWLKKKVQLGVETIYVCSIGDLNINLARSVAQWGQQEGYTDVVRTHNFIIPAVSGNFLKSIVITCHSCQARKELILSPEEEIQAALAKHIPAVAVGDVEIVDIVRSVGVQSKVVYRWLVDLSYEKGNSLNKLYYEEIKAVYNEVQEPVYLIRWTNDLRIFLIHCLRIPEENFVSFHIDKAKKNAQIIVNEGVIAARAIGSKGSNVRLTEELTGYNIQIDCNSDDYREEDRAQEITPEDILHDVICDHISEINHGEIEILSLIREPGIQSKIVVKSNNDIDVLKCCLGKDNKNVKIISEKLGERISFVKWEDNQDKFLINCLGISEFKVIGIECNFHDGFADVIVKDSRTAAMSIGEKGVNVKQAAKLFNVYNLNIYTPEEYEDKVK